MGSQIHWLFPRHIWLDSWLIVAYANTSTHDRRVQCCLGYTEVVELVGFKLLVVFCVFVPVRGVASWKTLVSMFDSGQSHFGLITASIRILCVLVPAEAVDRTGLVLAFKLGVGAG